MKSIIKKSKKTYVESKGTRKGMPLPYNMTPHGKHIWEGHPLAGALVILLFTFFTGLFFLFPQHVAAIGETTVVQINGPAQPPGFSPALLTIHMYDTVIYENHTNTAYAVTATDGSFSSSDIPPGQQWRVTFGSLGGHEYHTTEAPLGMVGEILVVSDAVSLLPTPMPQVEATVVTLIKAGKHPPDTIILPVTTAPVVKHKALPTSILNAFLSPLILSIGGGILFALVLILLGVLLYRRHAKRVKDEEEMDTLLEEIVPKPVTPKIQTPGVEAPVKKRRPLLAGLHWKRSHDDDDDDIDDDDEE